MTNKKNEKNKNDNKVSVPQPLPFKNIFQKENYVDESQIKWYRKTWVILTLFFTPLFFVGIYLLLTQKHYTALFKSMVIFFFILAIVVTILQMNGIDLMKNMPFYVEPSTNTNN